MNIQDKIKQDLHLRMKEKKSPLHVSTLRLVLSALEANSKAKKPLDELKVLEKEMKQRKEAALIYENNGRPQQALKEHTEANIIMHYMPKQLSEAKVLELISITGTDIDISGPRAIGAYMKVLKPLTEGMFNSKELATLVKAHICNVSKVCKTPETHEQESDENKQGTN